MAQEANLQASTRRITGKGAARTLRREGKVPGVIYGHDRAPEALTVDTSALNKMLVNISAGTTILDVAIDDRAPVKALIREIQRDALRPGQILHLDLYEVRADEKITLEVPVHLVGIPDGVRNFGGVLDHSLREVEIEVLPADIPEHVELDVTALVIGKSLHVSDVKIPNVTILTDAELTVATVSAPRAEEVATPVAAAEGAEAAAVAEPEVIKKGKTEEEEGAEEK